MSNNNYGNDPTMPAQPGQRPPWPQGQPGQQGQQGKLILGGSHNQQGQRRPYHYPPQPAPQFPPTTPAQPGQHQSYPQQGSPFDVPVRPGQDIPPGGSLQPGPMVDSPLPKGQRRRKRGRGCTIGCLGMLVILLIAGFILVPMGNRVMAFGSAISTQSPLSTQTNYMNLSQRTNMLVIGYGGTGHDGAYLTDSLVVVSLMPQSHHTSLVSVPRDLWVQNPPDSGSYSKINAVYTVASNGNKNPVAGGDALTQKVAKVTGMDVKYWMTINFNGFRELIDSIGGIDVYVPDAFTANYPKNDDPNVDASWITVKFKKGNQHMNGETAIRYARARYVLDNPAESTDFARSARQQIMIKAVLAKLKQTSTWPHFYDAMNALQKTIYTNLSLADLAQFEMKMDLNDSKSAKIGLSTQNVLAESTSDDGQSILLPQNNDWQRIIDYIQSKLYQ
ncbi:MAG: LCP family protein [Ktedonobacteraceae bacterium]|nr:LCP family protein [Ktedonobacteraceae bacterium]